jgi:hypothetical protein
VDYRKGVVYTTHIKPKEDNKMAILMDLISWAEEQTAITEKETMKLKVKQVILTKLETEDGATLKFKDGRVIYIDQLTAGGYRVSDFKVFKMVWVSDIQSYMPVRDIAVQKDLATAEEVADFIAENI